jgi:PhnB protein
MAMPSPGVRPHLILSDTEAFIAFAVAGLGAKEVHERVRMPGDPRIIHAEVEIGGTLVYLCDDFPEHNGGASRHPKALGGVPMLLHQCVANCDEAMARAVAAGAWVVMPAGDQFWGDRYGIVEDPFGYQWSFSHRLG